MIAVAVACIVFEGDARLIVVIVGDGDHIHHPDGQSRPKHLMPKGLGRVVLPSGIEDGRQQEEKQHLAYAPHHPFGLQGMVTKRHADDDERQQIDAHAKQGKVTEQFLAHPYLLRSKIGPRPERFDR